MRRQAASALAAVAAVLGTAVTGVVVAPAPAQATACSGADGVTVVVDFNELQGGITAGCDPDGGDGESATQVFEHAGYELTYVQSDPGFVCRVSGKPADNPCVRTPPATAYWSLWWSDGKSGDWVYATSGASGLEVPDGGYLGFSWHQGDGRAQPPDAVPTPRQAAPTPTQQPTRSGGGGHDGNSGGGSGATGDGGASSAAPTTAATVPTTTASAAGTTTTGGAPRTPDSGSTSNPATETGSSTVPAAAEITADPPGTVSTESTADDGGTVPTWIGLALAAVVLAAAGLIALLRRRERGGPPA